MSLIRDYTRRLLGRWVRLIVSHPALAAAAMAILTISMLFYSVLNFRINTDLNGMISENLPFRKQELAYSKAFPELSDTIVVVIDAASADLASSTRQLLAQRFSREREFTRIYTPGAGEFFEKNSLLYLSTDDLNGLADNLAAAQPLIAFLSRDLSLRGLFSILEQVLEQGPAISNQKINTLYKQLSLAFDSAARHGGYQLPWQELMMGEKETAGQRRQFIILKPELSQKADGLFAGEGPLKLARDVINEAGLDRKEGVKARITGDLALSYENLVAVRQTAGFAAVGSLLLVGLLIFIGLGRSFSLFFAGLLTLITGLIWTTGFAMVSIGSLNMISVTFAVLFIGLGIDYGIQFSLRYRELGYMEKKESLVTSAEGIGKALLLSCITTASGFYSFLPTSYSGVAELGLISGTGMFISFFCTVTLLPALLSLFPYREKIIQPGEGNLPVWERKKILRRLYDLPYKHGKTVLLAASGLTLVGILLLPRIYFDYNPLNLYDRKSESVSTIMDLFRDPESPPWTASALTANGEEARALAQSLSKLKEVKMAVTLFDFIPGDQPEKLGIISDMALFMPQGLGNLKVQKLSYEDDLRALQGFEEKLKKSIAFPGPANSDMKDLYDSILRFRNSFKNRAEGERAFQELSGSVLSNLPSLFARLEKSLQASTITEKNLPSDIVEQYLSRQGMYRVQIFPKEDLLNRAALERFVNAIRKVAPQATDAPVSVYESGKVVTSSFREAALLAILAIIAVLLLELKRVYWTALILVPLLVSVLLTGAVSVLFNIPLNFANVIVVPLLIGIGVHNGILFVLRYRTEPPASGNMLETSTARSILVSGCAAMISTFSLSLSPHRGISSMGILLTVCFAFLLVTTLLLLPSLIGMTEKHRIGKI